MDEIARGGAPTLRRAYEGLTELPTLMRSDRPELRPGIRGAVACLRAQGRLHSCHCRRYESIRTGSKGRRCRQNYNYEDPAFSEGRACGGGSPTTGTVGYNPNRNASRRTISALGAAKLGSILSRPSAPTA